MAKAVEALPSPDAKVCFKIGVSLIKITPAGDPKQRGWGAIKPGVPEKKKYNMLFPENWARSLLT